MPVKRKRQLEEFDPNKSDSDDANFDPGEDQPRRSAKKARPSKGSRGSGGRKRPNKYRGSDIDDDDELSDSNQDDSFGDDGFDDNDDEDDEDEAPVNASGRRARKAATKPHNYKESSGESDEEPAAVSEEEKPAPKPKKLLVKLRVSDKKLKEAQPTRRSTRARTEELDEPLIELSNSGRHVQVAQPARSSRSRSPEAASRATRATRGMKGVKMAPEPIAEATQESSVPKTEDDDVDELAADPEVVEAEREDDEEMEEPAEASVEKEAAVEAATEADDDDDDAPVMTRRRSTRASISAAAAVEPAIEAEAEAEVETDAGGRRRRLRSGLRKSVQEPSSDFEPGEESEEGGKSASESSEKNVEGDDSPMPQRGRGRPKRRSAKSSRRGEESGDEVELDRDELAEELHELRQDSRTRTRRRRSPDIIYQEPTTKRRRAATKPVNYFMPPLSAVVPEDDEPAEDPTATPARRRGGRAGASQAWERPLNTAFGPFGGGGGVGSLLGGPWGTGATGGVESDSSDDEMVSRTNIAGNVGMTPTTAGPTGLIPGLGGPVGVDGLGATPNVGKIKDKKALADADPLGVDMNVDFSKVGGLQGHIDQLKEMVQLPLLYPEMFLKFHVTPPRGVLFHGPPGTGKTLLARALANSVGSGGRKITFYMRKGADALSKWVGEAEKQLRLLFEEARRTQPSIIFFDEIDGLAPVRSSKQEQIHASIVSTLLALMDGMDGRGQVIVIGATNRPDNIDPALRRPGRFDREFYFPLPDISGRRSILDIHTKDWGLSDQFKQSLADNTKGYGGADLRALCTEAALNAIQRTYPQIYSSKEKLIVDPDKISVHATDFMISIKKMVPSSERSASSGAAPLPKSVEPLLRNQFDDAKKALDNILPRKKQLTALEEAMFEPFGDTDHGFGREALHQEFERSRIFRPRYLIHGLSGMGQNYLSSAILHYFEGVHVQHFDLPSLLGDGRPMEQVIVGMFTEIKRHKPSLIFIPNVDTWFSVISPTMAWPTFLSMLRSIPPTDPVLLLATSEMELKDLKESSDELIKELFGYSRKNFLEIRRPDAIQREEYFAPLFEYIEKHPRDFPDPTNRKKRVLDVLPVAPAPAPKPPSKLELKSIKKRDHQLLNSLKIQLQPIMDQINRRYKKFRQPVIPYQQLQYLFDEADPNYVRPDLAYDLPRPFEIVKDKHGVDVLRETVTGKSYYNLETTTIEERLSNGFYARPKDFLYDIRSLAKDAKNIGDKERTLKANELLSNVEVDVATIEQNTQHIDWEQLHQRQVLRAKEAAEKERKRKTGLAILGRVTSDIGGNDSDAGPVTLGEPVPGARTTSARFQVMSPLSNGHGTSGSTKPISNGTSGEGDVQMGGTDDAPVDNKPPTPPKPQQGVATQWPRIDQQPVDQSARATVGGTQLSQRSAITTVPPGVSPSALANDASTTKTSDPSDKSSGKWSTQATNGFHADQSSPVVGHMSNSQIPDTQRDPVIIPASQDGGDSPWIHSQVHGMVAPGSSPPSSQPQQSKSSSSGPKSLPPPRAPASLANVLNDSPVAAEESSGGSAERNSSGSQPQLVFHEAQVRSFMEQLTKRTSGCTIEQLEQINRDLMDQIWRTRSEWNRMKVFRDVSAVFNDTIRDIEQMQKLVEQSQATSSSYRLGDV